MAVERDIAYSFEDIYAAHPNGIGEVPDPITPFVRDIPVTNIKSEKSFKNAMRGLLRPIIQGYHENGMHVGGTWNKGRAILFISEHRKSITAVSVGVAGAGIIYMTRRSRIKGSVEE